MRCSVNEQQRSLFLCASGQSLVKYTKKGGPLQALKTQPFVQHASPLRPRSGECQDIRGTLLLVLAKVQELLMARCIQMADCPVQASEKVCTGLDAIRSMRFEVLAEHLPDPFQ